MNVYETIKENSSDLSKVREGFQELIKDEQEAIDGYRRIEAALAPYLPATDYFKVQELFSHIIDEETEHIEELESLFKEIEPTE